MAEPLADTLDQIRAALRRGDYAALPALSGRAEEQMLSLAVPDAARLGALRASAESTGGCLLAAMRGIRAARQRLADLKEGTLSTYDTQGRRQRLSTGDAPTRRY